MTGLDKSSERVGSMPDSAQAVEGYGNARSVGNGMSANRRGIESSPFLSQRLVAQIPATGHTQKAADLECSGFDANRSAAKTLRATCCPDIPMMEDICLAKKHDQARCQSRRDSFPFEARNFAET